MDIESHALSPELLRADNFEAFLYDRRRRLVALIEKAMGKTILLAEEQATFA